MKIKRFEFNMSPINYYVSWDETNEAVVIDPDCFYDEGKRALENFIVANHLDVRHLLNTHLHLNHIFGNPFIPYEFGLSAEASQADEYWINKAPKQGRMSDFQLNETPMPLGKYLYDGNTITSGDATLEAIHVSGHSPRSLVYYCQAENCMFSGDALFQGSIDRVGLTGGSFDGLREYVCSRLFVLSDETIAYPGYNVPTTIGTEKAEDPFFG